MIRQIAVATISIGIGACASSGPEAPPPAEAAGADSVDTVESVNPSAPSGDGFYALETSNAPETVIMVPVAESDQIVCRRERATGTKFSRRVCRTRAEIEARAEKDQEWWYQKYRMRQ